MIIKDMKVGIKEGLNVGTVALFIQEASRFDSSIYLHHGNKKINAKSIMGMMTLGVNPGQQLEFTVDGEDEQSAMMNLEEYLAGNN